MTTIVGIVLLLLAVILIVIGALAATRRLPGNSLIGIRVAEVRKDKEIWELAHQIAGPFWAIGGVSLLFAGFIAFRASGWGWLVPVVLVLVAVFFVGAGANAAARRAAAIDVAREVEKNNPATTPPAPKVDLNALRRAANASDDQDGPVDPTTLNPNN
ncbi:SdpI family protein [Corynebacterium guangdongense]|uniref:Membrane protein n=1 Tax=Corynebacterium guangdongense TaxID=1783348 RepID=A0ABU2A057_9CORY|nr:SdpI family protein [Corynebacterium guangdongense]MDR7330564.1 putative membrane protein [Corynebacterium guangdongense]WJZ19118.1 hypothetical protein CGUA_12955 [Corynebacterium guangdongense]